MTSSQARNIYQGSKSHADPRPIFWKTPKFSTTVKMSSVGGAGVGAGLYAVVSNPAQIGAQPKEAEGKAHHLKNGKGFLNPWESYREMPAYQLVWSIFS